MDLRCVASKHTDFLELAGPTAGLETQTQIYRKWQKAVIVVSPSPEDGIIHIFCHPNTSTGLETHPRGFLLLRFLR